MALIHANFHSESLQRQVCFNAVIPIRKEKPLRTLYLLHGIYGNYTNWVTNTRVALWAEERNLAVIMPSAENSFYLDNENSRAMYADFFGREIVEIARELFPLSHARSDTFIAGLSMGGYGAMRTGLKFYETFGAIAGMSSAFILEDAQNFNDDSSALIARKSYFESVFGDLQKVIGSDKDPKKLILDLKKEDLPRIYLCCGTEDFIIEQNRDFHGFLREKKIAHTYVEGAGAHNWLFWDKHISKVINWLLGEN